MKKIILTILLGSVTIFATVAQEKGFFVTASGSLGANNFNYEINDNKSNAQFGYGGALGVQYFFNYHWGVSTGVGLMYYNTKSTFSSSWTTDPEHYSYANMFDPLSSLPENQNYTLNLELNNWTEKQRAYFLEIPLMLMYQTKWGKQEAFGMYFGIGGKIQVPVFGEEYEVTNNSGLGIYGLTEDRVLWGTPYAVKGTDFGFSDKTGFSGDLSLKLGFAASAELGFLVTLSRRVDLSLGAYFDYGLTNVNKNSGKKDNLIATKDGATNIPSNQLKENMQYNGYMNSYAVNDVNLLAYGAKVGLRVKLGKLKDRYVPEVDPLDTCYLIQETRTSSKDTLFIIYMPQHDTTGGSQYRNPGGNNNQGGNGTNRVQPTDDELRILFEPIFFDLDKDKLLPASITILNRKAAILERYPMMTLLITGNTCDLGTSPHNIALGQRRAAAAEKYLENKGIGKKRIATVSQSFSHPMMPNTNEDNREKNRRCDFYPTGY